MSTPMERRAVTMDSPEGAVVVTVMEAFRQALLPLDIDWSDPTSAMLVATAAAHFAGQQFGTMLIAGVATPRDQKRFVDIMATNARMGIKLGQERAARVEQAIVGGVVQ